MEEKNAISGHLPPEFEFLGDVAETVGFVAIGVAPAGRVEERALRRYNDWLSAGKHCDMNYLHSYQDQRGDPRHPGIQENATAVVCAALPYGKGAQGEGFWQKVSRHARARDYHDVVRERLGVVARSLIDHFTGCLYRVFVDSAPVMERAWAMSTGIGFLGRNGSIIVPGVGPEVVLGEIVCSGTPIPRPVLPAEPFGLCADCSRCLDACPTGALDEEALVDSSRCLSYWSIERREGEIPEPVRDVMSLVFGCDVCTSVCPLCNGGLVSALEPAPGQSAASPGLEEIVLMDEETLTRLVRGTPLLRTGARALKRNARYVIQNEGLK